MRLTLKREPATAVSTPGQMYVDGIFECYTLERPWLNNAKGVSCILDGTYEVTKTFSGHFQRMMPLLLKVPDRSEIRIHPANWAKQLEGCIAVGRSRGVDFIGNSQKAFDALWTKMENAWARGEKVTIAIESAQLKLEAKA